MLKTNKISILLAVVQLIILQSLVKSQDFSNYDCKKCLYSGGR